MSPKKLSPVGPCVDGCIVPVVGAAVAGADAGACAGAGAADAHFIRSVIELTDFK